MIKKVLVANRGEIAVRIINTLKELGIYTVAVYSKEDEDALHVRKADESYYLGVGSLAETYLNINRIIELAHKSGAQAVHPGYGFLSENHLFAEACNLAGLVFVGPTPEVIKQMGNKIAAKELANSLGIPILESFSGNTEYLQELNGKVTYPVLVKAAMGGGGKGMKIAEDQVQLDEYLRIARSESERYFGNGEVYLEKYLKNPKHIEVQILADGHGNVIHLYDRECSVQRRYQKIIEEAPAPSLSDSLRKNITNDAIKIAKAIGYKNAGTIEFLLDENGSYYFLEMNTRIQVEHPVTEKITGIDIVKEQLAIARGDKLNYRQEDIVPKGHAIEVRVYSEDPLNNFAPAAGTIEAYIEPEQSKNLRIDSGLDAACEISPSFDPLISKVVGFGNTRVEVVEKLVSKLDHYVIHGVQTNLSLLHKILDHIDFRKNQMHTKYIEEKLVHFKEEILHKSVDLNLKLLLIAALIVGTQGETKAKETKVWNTLGFWRHNNTVPIEYLNQEYQLEFESYQPGELLYVWNGNNYKVNYSLKENRIQLSDQKEHIAFNFSLHERGKIILSHKGLQYYLKRKDILDYGDTQEAEELNQVADGGIKAPVYGKVLKMLVQKKQKVNKGDPLLVLESMKMENQIISPISGVVAEIKVRDGTQVKSNDVLIIIA